MTTAGQSRRRPFQLRRRENIQSVDGCEDSSSLKSRSGSCRNNSNSSNSSNSKDSAAADSSSSPQTSASVTSARLFGSSAAAVVMVMGSLLLLRYPVLLDRRRGFPSSREDASSPPSPPRPRSEISPIPQIKPGTHQPNHNHTANGPQYYIIVDGGSTGSRLHVFHFSRSAAQAQGGGHADEDAWECRRLGSARAGVPLTDFAVWENLSHDGAELPNVANHLLPAFREAAMWIPPEHRSSTRVLYQATAGMRLLPLDVQQRTYQTLHAQLIQAATSNDFPFALELRDIDTLSGDDEGFYGAVAANYLDGAIDANLRFRTPHRTPDSAVGALDMGGSSTQIVFLPDTDGSNRNSKIPSTTGNPIDEANTLQTDGFFIHSYLSYGVDQFRLQLWDHWIDEHRRKAACAGADIHTDSSSDDHSMVSPDSCEAPVLENPCVFQGYRIEHRGHTLLGAGKAHKCVQKVQSFLRRTAAGGNETSGVGGVVHPPVRGKFYAMSNYFYALDSLRHFASPATAAKESGEGQEEDGAAATALHRAWPTPTLHELTQALPLMCDRAWLDVLGHHDATPHAYTQPHLLPHRCADAAYMVALLQHGFGFDPHARNIEFALDVNGSEVEWTLGMALVLWNNDRREVRESEPVPSEHLQSAADLGDKGEEACPAEADTPPISRDGGNPLTRSSDDALSQNDTAEAVARPRKRDAMLTSTQTIMRHVADFIVTASAFDYMHTM